MIFFALTQLPNTQANGRVLIEFFKLLMSSKVNKRHALKAFMADIGEADFVSGKYITSSYSPSRRSADRTQPAG